MRNNKIVFCAGNDREVLTTDGDESVGNFGAGKAPELSADGKKTLLRFHSLMNQMRLIILPRQARDEHGENSFQKIVCVHAGTNLTLDCYAKPGTGNKMGGQVAIIAGGAAGQIRRIVVRIVRKRSSSCNSKAPKRQSGAATAPASVLC